MRKYGIRKTILAVLLLCILSGMTVCAAVSDQIYDEAGLLSAGEAESLSASIDGLREKWDFNFIILSTNDAGGKDEIEYADDFYYEKGYADNERKGGLTLFIDMDNRKVRVKTDGDVIYYLTDERIEDVIDAGYEALRNGEYYDCYMDMLAQAVVYFERGIPSNQYTYDEETGRIKRYRSIQWYEALIALLVAAGAAGIAGVSVFGRYRLKWGQYTYDYKENGRLDLKRDSDRFINKSVTARRIPKNNGSGGSGGGGGRSSTHSSGGGHRSGGGSRGF